MQRANRHYFTGYVWHINHRCHKEEFLLKFNRGIKKGLGLRQKDGRKIVGDKKSYQLREPAIPYGVNFTPKSGFLRLKNTYYWDDII